MKLFSLIFPVAQILFLNLCEAESNIDSNRHEYCQANQHDSCSNEIHNHHQLLDGTSDNICFRAAVFEHNRIDLGESKKSLGVNLNVYHKVAKIAADHGANIIVFPEDGLFIGTREDMMPVLTDIPDPESLANNNNNPCTQPTKFESSDILRNLSCIARDNNLYVVANFGTKQSCEPTTKVNDRVCPDVGYFAFNTDIILNSDGTFIKRYRKYNTFIEDFDKAPLEVVYFDSPFGRFGVFTCFDMLFRSPAIDLVEKHHINTCLFPTWWYDELPLLSAIQFQDGWSWTNKVNLLASNIQKRDLGSGGSGIYSGNNSIYIGTNAVKPKLIIASLPKEYSISSKCDGEFNPVKLDIETDQPELLYKHRNYLLLTSDSIYSLKQNEEKRTICNGKICCTIDYKINPAISDVHLLKKIVLIVRDNNRLGHFNWYEQVCALVTLKSPINTKQLNETSYSMEGIASFDKLSLVGTFNSKYVYPISAHNVSTLISRNERKFNCNQDIKQKNLFSCELNYNGTLTQEKVYSFGMYGRLYDSDIMPQGW